MSRATSARMSVPRLRLLPFGASRSRRSALRPSVGAPGSALRPPACSSVGPPCGAPPFVDGFDHSNNPKVAPRREERQEGLGKSRSCPHKCGGCPQLDASRPQQRGWCPQAIPSPRDPTARSPRVAVVRRRAYAPCRPTSTAGRQLPAVQPPDVQLPDVQPPDDDPDPGDDGDSDGPWSTVTSATLQRPETSVIDRTIRSTSVCGEDSLSFA